MRVLPLLLLLAACATPAPSWPVTRGAAEAPDGLSVVYDVRGEGEIGLVFVHGWCCNRSFWRGQADFFGRDWRVVTLDLGGHGESGTERESWSIPVLAEDVVAVVDALALERVVLVGHSMGGPVCLAAAARLGSRALAVIGVDTMHDADFELPGELLEGLAAQYATDFDEEMDTAVRAMFPPSADPELIAWVISQARASDREAAVALMRSFEGVDLRELLSGAGVPVRCLNAVPGPPAGRETDVETNQKYADFDVELLQDVGHYPMLERPREFNAELRGVLADLRLR